MTQASSSRPKNTLRWILIAALIMLMLCFSLVCIGGSVYGLIKYFRVGDMGLLSAQQTAAEPQGVCVVLIAKGNGLSAYLINMDTQSIRLPAGSYYAEVLTPDGALWAMAPLTIPDGGYGYGTVVLGSQPSTPLTFGTADVLTLTNFLLGVDRARLAYLEAITNNFQGPIFDPTWVESWDQEAQLLSALEALPDQADVSLSAQAFMARAGQSYMNQPQVHGLARPSANPLDKILAFFGILNEESAQAREEILSVYPFMSIWEKEAAYEALSPELQMGSLNFDEFIQKVERNEINRLTTVRRDLFTIGPYAGLWQTLHPEVNRPSGEIIHRVGAKALERGAELYVDVGKGVLSIQFAGIDTGFEYVEKTIAWGDYVQAWYGDPGSALVDEVRGQVESQISDGIKGALLERFPGLDEALAEDLAGRIKDRVISQVIENAGQVTGDGQPESPPPVKDPDQDDSLPDGPESTEAAVPLPAETEAIPEATATEEDLVIEARYVGTYTDTLLSDGCVRYGDIELLLYTNNQAALGFRSTSDSCVTIEINDWSWTDPIQGTHGAGIFSVTLREGFDIIGQYDQVGMSGSMQDALSLFLCEGKWVP